MAVTRNQATAHRCRLVHITRMRFRKVGLGATALQKLALLFATLLVGGCSVFEDKDTQGTFAWVRTYRGQYQDAASAVECTSDGGYIIAGRATYGAGESDLLLIRTDQEGNEMWTRTYGGPRDECGYGVQQTSDGGFIVVGSTGSYGAGGSDIYLVRTDANGDTVWTRTYGGLGLDCGTHVMQASDGGFVLAGSKPSDSMGYDAFVMKTDASGACLWECGLPFSQFCSLRPRYDGYLVAGAWETSTGECFAWADIDSFGGLDSGWWYARPSATCIPSSVQQTPDGGFEFLASGVFNTSRGVVDSDLEFGRMTAAGELLWAKTRGTLKSEFALAASRAVNGDLVIAGGTADYYEGYSTWRYPSALFVLRVDSCGSDINSTTYDMGSQLVVEDRPVARFAPDGGCVFVGNASGSQESDGGIFLARVNP